MPGFSPSRQSPSDRLVTNFIEISETGIDGDYWPIGNGNNWSETFGQVPVTRDTFFGGTHDSTYGVQDSDSAVASGNFQAGTYWQTLVEKHKNALSELFLRYEIDGELLDEVGLGTNFATEFVISTLGAITAPDRIEDGLTPGQWICSTGAARKFADAATVLVFQPSGGAIIGTANAFEVAAFRGSAPDAYVGKPYPTTAKVGKASGEYVARIKPKKTFVRKVVPLSLPSREGASGASFSGSINFDLKSLVSLTLSKP